MLCKHFLDELVEILKNTWFKVKDVLGDIVG